MISLACNKDHHHFQLPRRVVVAFVGENPFIPCSYFKSTVAAVGAPAFLANSSVRDCVLMASVDGQFDAITPYLLQNKVLLPKIIGAAPLVTIRQL